MMTVADAVVILRDEISGAEEDRARDTRLTEVIELLEHLETKAFVQEYLLSKGTGSFDVVT